MFDSGASAGGAVGALGSASGAEILEVLAPATGGAALEPAPGAGSFLCICDGALALDSVLVAVDCADGAPTAAAAPA